MAQQHLGLHVGQRRGVIGQPLRDPADRIRQPQGQPRPHQRGVAGMRHLLRVVVEDHRKVALQRLLFELLAGEALHRLLHRTQLVDALADVRQAVLHRLPRALGQLDLVRQHRAHTRQLVGEDRRVRPRDLAQRGQQGGAVGVEMDLPPPVAPRWFFQPVALEQDF